VLFAGLSALVIDEEEDAGAVVRLGARSSRLKGVCPRCGSSSRRVHAWHVRRLVCSSPECPQRTIRQQIPELALRYARRTLRLSAMIGRLAVTLAGRAGATVLAGLGVAISRSSVLRVLMALPPAAADHPSGVVGG
jgi:hypothetical protein